jgi:hypothetical protein
MVFLLEKPSFANCRWGPCAKAQQKSAVTLVALGNLAKMSLCFLVKREFFLVI